MKKKILITTAIALALVCSFCLGAGAGASGTSQQITATLEPGVTVTIDGVPQQFFDANGNRVYPISYNGSTYLPMRTICKDVAGYQVSWDQATRTAAIATKSVDGVDLLDTMRAYNVAGSGVRHIMSSDRKTTEVNGYTLSHWVECKGSSNNKDKYSEASFNVEGKYDTVTFRYYSDQNATLQVLGDNGSVLWEQELVGGDLYQASTANLLRTNQLSFRFINRTDRATNCYIYDARLK